MSMPRVFLARHGVTEWSISGQHTGRTDIPLTAHGEEVMRQLAPSIVGVGEGKLIDPTRLSRILVSPRLRSQRTLELLLAPVPAARRAEVPAVEVEVDCREWDYGAYEGKKTDEIRALAPGWDIWRDGTPDHPERPSELPGESAQHMSDRIDGVINNIRATQRSFVERRKRGEDVGGRTGDVLVVCHGHFNRVFIARWLNLPLTQGRLFEMDAGGMVVLGYTHHSFDEPTIGGMFSSKTGPKPDTAASTTAVVPAKTAGAIPEGASPATDDDEAQYLSLVSRVLSTGERRPDRTGTGTIALFAPQPSLRFDLSNGRLPLLTTKRVFVRGVLEELLWFVSGSTDSQRLTERGVHIWDGNGSREFLEARGLGHRRAGDLGPVYGFQWRHFGAAYRDCDADYTGQGVDQLREVIDKIRNNPTDRRIVMSAWNPSDLDKMALPPCHMFVQFYVSNLSGRRRLSAQMYQRSCDLGLGVPFNIASYALLVHMVAKVTDCEPDQLSICMGDAHVYLDHVEPLKGTLPRFWLATCTWKVVRVWNVTFHPTDRYSHKGRILTPFESSLCCFDTEQLARQPLAFPTLRFARDVKDIDDFKYDDFQIDGYTCHGKIDMRMSV
ncbi:Thymidylate synthase [Thecaphora frezii]